MGSLHFEIQGMLSGSHHFGWRTISRDPDIQFTWEVRLHVAAGHTSLFVHEKALFRLSWPPNGHLRKQITCEIFGLSGPYNKYTCHNSMVSRNGSTTKRPFVRILKRFKFQLTKFYFLTLFIYFESKITAFQSTISGHLFRSEKLKMQTYNSPGNCFHLQLKSISRLLYMGNPCSGYRNLHPND
jgi:hypothetical protein